MRVLARVRFARWLAGLAIVGLVGACASGSPLRVERGTREQARRSLRTNVAETGQLSDYTKIVLRNHDLMSRHAGDPDAAIAQLHLDVMEGRGGADEYFALTEISYKRAEDIERAAWRKARAREKRRNRGMVRQAPYYTSDETPLLEEANRHYRAAAVYAYTFLFSRDDVPTLTPVDPRVRIAADLYNLAIVESFRDLGGFDTFTAGRFETSFGELVVDFDPMDLRWENRLLIQFLPAGEFEIRGLRNRYRRAGLGAPLAARTVPIDPNDPTGHLVAPKAVVSVNAFLRIDDPRAQLASGVVQARLVVTPSSEAQSLDIDGTDVPLEVQPSVALAASLEESDVWQGRLGVFFGRLSKINEENDLFGWEPRRRGQIPVVFIHGTMSTPVVWTDVVNDLLRDPVLRERYQFLFFAYESGNPILYSGMKLRRALERAVAAFDPQGTDACLRDMVLVGHSQGGLLAKAVSIDPGTALWDANFEVPLEQTRYSKRTKALLKEAVFIEPMPDVGRVIFISTPHRGSYLASSDILRRLSAWAIRFPGDLAAIAVESAGIGAEDDERYPTLRLSTAVDNMSPNHWLIQALAAIPVAPSIPAHSIISVKPGQDIATGNDGVVEYRSAHIEEAQSELVVRSSHSSQAQPATIEEVRRILLMHEAQAGCAAGG